MLAVPVVWFMQIPRNGKVFIIKVCQVGLKFTHLAHLSFVMCLYLAVCVLWVCQVCKLLYHLAH